MSKLVKNYSGSGSSQCLNTIKIMEMNFQNTIAEKKRKEKNEEEKRQNYKNRFQAAHQNTLPFVRRRRAERVPSRGQSVPEIHSPSRCLLPPDTATPHLITEQPTRLTTAQFSDQFSSAGSPLAQSVSFLQWVSVHQDLQSHKTTYCVYMGGVT